VSEPRGHYSYTTYANPDTARTFDERRFGGPIGDIIASEQARVLAGFVGDVRDRPVLDVGTGTGRAALLLARCGARVTGVDASAEMLAVARRRAADEQVDVQFLPGDVHALDFADRSFDVVVSLRVLMHTVGWRQSLAELCRVSRDLVVIDYPSAHSLAAIESVARHVTHAFGANTEPYRVFRDRTIASAFDANGFRIRSIHKQFVLPIALHKALGSRRFTAGVEDALARGGLLRAAGSPVTVVAQRCARS